jgi:hypothetical protein
MAFSSQLCRINLKGKMKQSKVKRIAIAAILGTVVMFIWGGFSHLVLFIGTGFTPLPNEEKVIETLKSSIPKQGLYFFPGKDFKKRYTPEEESAFTKKFQFGPVGMLIYRPVGGTPLSPKKLITQLISNFLSSLTAAFVASFLLATYWKRVLAITLLGGLACVSVGMIYWNWYEFPTNFFLAQCIDLLVSFFLAGLLIAKIVPQPVYIN